MRKALWTSRQVADALSVGVSSVKRWTDEGRLESARTIGGHRRYDPDAVRRFAEVKGLPTEKLPSIESPSAYEMEDLSADEIRLELLRVLKSGDAGQARTLISYPVASVADRTAFLDRVVGEAMRLVGEGWREGRWSVDEEHRASYIVSDVLDRMRPPAEGPRIRRAVLAAPPAELHDLPLRMVRLVLEWSGWETDYYGADVPWSALEYAIVRRPPELLALTAREAEPFEREEFDDVVRECRTRAIRIAVGGEWARGGVHRQTAYTRFRTLRGFESWIRGFDRTSMAASSIENF